MKRRRDFEANFSHTKKRLSERYGLELDRTTYTQLCLACKHGRLRPFSQKDDETVALKWNYCDREVIVVYNFTSERVETVLPPP